MYNHKVRCQSDILDNMYKKTFLKKGEVQTFKNVPCAQPTQANIG